MFAREVARFSFRSSAVGVAHEWSEARPHRGDVVACDVGIDRSVECSEHIINVIF